MLRYTRKLKHKPNWHKRQIGKAVRRMKRNGISVDKRLLNRIP